MPLGSIRESTTLVCINYTRNLEVDGWMSLKKNLFGQSVLLMNSTYIVFSKVIHKFIE